MKYINPYDIAEFFGGLSLANFKKFKKRVLNELELEDNEIVINNQKFSKNDIYEILEEIDKNKDLLNNYFALYMKKDINYFLYGENQNIETILAKINFLDENLKNFITPFLKDRLKEIYKNAFKNKNLTLLKFTPPISKIYLDEIYEPIYKSLKNIQNELQSKKNQRINLSNIQEIIGNIDIINQLPDYFDKRRNDIALTIRGLSVDMWNDYEDADLAIELINLALKFKLNSKNRDMFENDKKQLEKMKEKEKGNKLLKEIENILNSYGNFDVKLQKIKNYLLNNFINDEILNNTFRIVFNYIKNNQVNLLLLDNLNVVEKFLIFLKNNSNDYQFKEIVNSNLNDIRNIRNKIQAAKTKESFSSILSIGFWICVVLGFATPVFWGIAFVIMIIMGIMD